MAFLAENSTTIMVSTVVFCLCSMITAVMTRGEVKTSTRKGVSFSFLPRQRKYERLPTSSVPNLAPPPRHTRTAPT